MGHKAQSAPADAEYVCMGQVVQVVCPVAATHTLERSAGKAATTVAVPVDWPAAQLAQAMVDAVLYLAMPHAVHEVPATAASVSVTEPAGQVAHIMLPADAGVGLAATQLPAVHAVQAAVILVPVTCGVGQVFAVE